MSIRETSRGLSRQARDRWPLDTTSETTSQEGNYMPVPQVQNHFAVDGPDGLNLTPAQKRALLDQLLKEAADTAGQTIDLSKPILPPRPAPGTPEFEYPKMMYQHQSGHVVEVRNPEQEKAAIAQGFKTKPSLDRDYSRATVGKVAPVKVAVEATALPEEETINAEDLVAQEQAATEESQAEEPSSSRRRR